MTLAVSSLGITIPKQMKQILSGCKCWKVLFTRKTTFSTIQFSFECYMMKQILSLEKQILDYRIFFWVLYHGKKSLWVQGKHILDYKFSFGYYIMRQILSGCKCWKVLFTRKTNFSTIQFSFECYMMKQILSLEKQILDYGI